MGNLLKQAVFLKCALQKQLNPKEIPHDIIQVFCITILSGLFDWFDRFAKFGINAINSKTFL
jgi:hypothetical protein